MNSFNKIPYKAVIVLFSKIIIKRLSRDQLNIFRKVEKITKSLIKLMQSVKEVLTTMQTEGIIEPVTTPTDWSSGMVPVTKPGKSKVRICVH